MKRRMFLGGCVLALSAVSCAAEPVQVDTSRVELTNARAPAWPDLGRGVDRSIRIQLGPDSLLQCRRVSPKFPFDSAIVEVQERPELDAIAGCLNHPSMATRAIVLIGRADPRGQPGYNEALGMQRAMRIKEILVQSGVSGSRIQVRSRGAEDAVGDTPDYSYGYDRRVDVVVLGVHAPL